MKGRKPIIGIDPGTTQSAYVVWDGKQIVEKGIMPNPNVLLKCAQIAPLYRMAYEFIQSFGMAVGKEVFETVFWVGRFYQEFMQHGEEEQIDPMRVYRKDVKLYFCNTVRAKDANIRQALIDKFGPPGVKKAQGLLYGVKADEWSALAVAVFAWECEQ